MYYNLYAYKTQSSIDLFVFNCMRNLLEDLVTVSGLLLRQTLLKLTTSLSVSKSLRDGSTRILQLQFHNRSRVTQSETMPIMPLLGSSHI